MDLKKVCRCCLAEDCSNEFSTEHYNDGNPEIYSKMLINTFNIKLSSHNNVKDLICEDCIRCLRDAANFKKKVEAAEASLLKMLKGKAEELEGELPVKVEYDEDDFDDRVDDSFDDNFVWDVGDTALKDKGQIFVIKLEPKEIIKNNTKIDKSDDNAAKTRKSICSEKIDISERISNVTLSRGVLNTIRTKNVTRRKQEKNIGIKKQNTAEKRIRRQEQTEVSEAQVASRENSLNLILNSNMCLFKSLKTKYRCFHCKESFMTISELREHSKMHSDVKNLKIRFNLLKGLSYKNVDISGLSCKICSTNCDDLNTLRSHLVDKHNIEFKSGEHFLIPYKLEEDFKCVMCGQNFNTFSRLAIHMNSHYTHNVCEICGVSYINRMSLRMHVSSVHREKKCSQCPATFSTHYMKVKHMKKAHNLGAYKRYCLLCDKTFRYTYLLVEHKIKEHGVKRQISNCSDCGKTFLSPQNLKVHIRSVHIKERNYPCSVCGMRFFTKCDQKRHEMTHEDVKSFSCSHCEGKFKTKDSWRRHLRRQHERLYESQ